MARMAVDVNADLQQNMAAILVNIDQALISVREHREEMRRNSSMTMQLIDHQKTLFTSLIDHQKIKPTAANNPPPPIAANNPSPPTATATIPPKTAPISPPPPKTVLLKSTFKAFSELPPTVPSKVSPKQIPPTIAISKPTLKSVPTSLAPKTAPASSQKTKPSSKPNHTPKIPTLKVTFGLWKAVNTRINEAILIHHNSGFSHQKRVFRRMIWDPGIT